MLYNILKILIGLFYISLGGLHLYLEGLSRWDKGFRTYDNIFVLMVFISIPVTIAVLRSIYQIRKLRKSPEKFLSLDPVEIEFTEEQVAGIWHKETQKLLKRYNLPEDFRFFSFPGFNGISPHISKKGNVTHIFVPEPFATIEGLSVFPTYLAVSLHKRKAHFNESKIILNNLLCFCLLALPLFLTLGRFLAGGETNQNKGGSNAVGNGLIFIVSLVAIHLAYNFLIKPIVNLVVGTLLYVLHSNDSELINTFNTIDDYLFNPSVLAGITITIPFFTPPDSYIVENSPNRETIGFALDPFNTDRLIKCFNKCHSFMNFDPKKYGREIPTREEMISSLENTAIA